MQRFQGTGTTNDVVTRTIFSQRSFMFVVKVDNSSLTGESEPQARSPEFTHEVCLVNIIILDEINISIAMKCF